MVLKDLSIFPEIRKFFKEAESPKGWKEFLKERYESGKKKLTNTNPDTKDKFPEVSMVTLYKNDSQFKSKIQKEFQDWSQHNKQDPDSKTKNTDLDSLVRSIYGEDSLKEVGPKDFKLRLEDDSDLIPDFEDEYRSLYEELRDSLYGEYLEDGPVKEDYDTLEEYEEALETFEKVSYKKAVKEAKYQAEAVIENKREEHLNKIHKFSYVKDILGYDIRDALPLLGLSFSKDYISKIEVKVNVREKSIYFDMRCKPYFLSYSRHLYKDKIFNSFLEISDDAPKGLGTGVFVSQVLQARKLGLRYIECHAYRSSMDRSGYRDPSMIGYKVWPKMGYDGEIPEDCLDLLPEEIKDMFDLLGYEEPYMVSHLYSLPDNEGIKWWEQNGEAFEAEFDLSEDSYSMRTLQAYLEKKSNSKTASRKPIRRDPFLRSLLTYSYK